MTAFDLNIVRKVRNACESGSIPMTEDVVSFLLGCHLDDSGSDVAFQVGRINDEFGFSPDVDVLEIDDNKAIGYEVKGVRANRGITKSQLYTGLGQANCLLSPPVTLSDGYNHTAPLLRKSYVVYPDSQIDASEDWVNTLVKSVENISSVGLISLSHTNGPEITMDAEPNIPDDNRCQNLNGLAREACLRLHGEQLKSYLLESDLGKSVKNPNRSLEVLAMRIADEHNIALVSFT